MPTYVYETIPQKSGDVPQRFEVEQRMSDKALELHPESGLPVQRVISGGADIRCVGSNNTGSQAPSAHVHGPGCNH